MMTREKRLKKHREDASVKLHDAMTSLQKYDVCPALLTSLVSHFLSHVSCLKSLFSLLLSHSSCLLSRGLLSHISSLTSIVSCLLSPVLSFLSHVPSAEPNYAKLFQTETNNLHQQYYIYTISLTVTRGI